LRFIECFFNDDKVVFGDSIVGSDGIILDSDTFDYIEVFETKKIKEKQNDQSE
jgi:hypothetical protein